MKNFVNDTRLVIPLLTAGIMCLVNSVAAQPPSLTTTVDKNNILIGQQLHFRVTASMPDNTYRLSWFNLPDSFGNFVAVTKNKIDSSFSDGNLNFSQDILLTSFDSGRQVIPPLELIAATLNGDSSFTIHTDSIAVNVLYSPMDSIMPFHDIKNIIEVKKIFPWWAWALCGVGVLALILWILFLFKFFRKKKEVLLFESKLSPYEEAMELLRGLEKEDLLSSGKLKEYHTRLSGIFKRYLSRKTNTYQLHLTADELLVELSGLSLTPEQLSAYATCLRMGNAVKFAKFEPPVYENEKCFAGTREMITAIHSIVNKKPEDVV